MKDIVKKKVYKEDLWSIVSRNLELQSIYRSLYNDFKIKNPSVDYFKSEQFKVKYKNLEDQKANLLVEKLAGIRKKELIRFLKGE